VLRAAERFVEAIEARSIALTLQFDMTMPQLRMVMMLRRLGRANGRQLAAALRLTPGAIVAICDHLEDQGYVRRVIDRGNRRFTWFELTDDGLTRLMTLKNALAASAESGARSRTLAVIAGLTASERAGFIKVADTFVEALSTVLDGLETQAEAPKEAALR